MYRSGISRYAEQSNVPKLIKPLLRDFPVAHGEQVVCMDDYSAQKYMHTIDQVKLILVQDHPVSEFRYRKPIYDTFVCDRSLNMSRS
jgi:hypothetical protein